MPKSKGRDTRSKQRSYVPKKPQKKAPKRSPKWYGWLVVGTMLLGVLMVVLNYMNVFPGGFNPIWMWAGMGLVGVGFILATNLR